MHPPNLAAQEKLLKTREELEAVKEKAADTIASLTGQPTHDDLAALSDQIKATLDSAITIAKGNPAFAAAAAAAGGGDYAAAAPANFQDAIQQLLSADWMKTAPPSIELLGTAMSMRRHVLEMERDHARQLSALEAQRRLMDLQQTEAAHAMSLQQQLLQAQLQQQALEHQKRLLESQQAAGGSDEASRQQLALLQQQQHAALMAGATLPAMVPYAATLGMQQQPYMAATGYIMPQPQPMGASFYNSAPGSPHRLSPSWQYETGRPLYGAGGMAASGAGTLQRPMYPAPAHDA